MNKEEVLSGAEKALNSSENPWEVVVEGDTIIGKWKWMDARFFSLDSVSDEQKEYVFTVTLKDNKKWKEQDTTKEKKSNASFSDGKLSFGTSSSSFKGKTTQKTVSFGIGQNKKDGSLGIVKSSLDTSAIKEPIRNYLKQCGWKKAGLFG